MQNISLCFSNYHKRYQSKRKVDTQKEDKQLTLVCIPEIHGCLSSDYAGPFVAIFNPVKYLFNSIHNITTLTSTLIIPHITKTSSNNCLLY